MASVELLLPAMGEGVTEATVTKWLITEGSEINEDDPVVEVATDKVDSEVPSPVSGKIEKILIAEGTVVQVGSVLAIIGVKDEELRAPEKKVLAEVEKNTKVEQIDKEEEERESKEDEKGTHTEISRETPSGRFLSPLVRSIAAAEGLTPKELDSINGSGQEKRITKGDVLAYLEKRKAIAPVLKPVTLIKDDKEVATTNYKLTPKDEVIEMGRIRKLISDHMVMSKRTSPHVTSFIDADLTGIMKWREKIKDSFLKIHGAKLTLTPIFIDATARALREFPMINVSVEGDKIIKKGAVNIGMATALPDGNLIVPVIKNADTRNLAGLAIEVGDLATRARAGKLKPDEITGGTFTLTNFGSYNNLAGTPIINQPQCAILGTGVVKKVPAVIETEDGDAIAIRHIMILSLSYDHRVIDGALAGQFINRIKDILENYNPGI